MRYWMLLKCEIYLPNNHLKDNIGHSDMTCESLIDLSKFQWE